MKHKCTISDLDDFEAEHIAQILNDYKAKMLSGKIEAIVEDYKDGGHRSEWFDEHIKWHESILTKVKWSNKEG